MDGSSKSERQPIAVTMGDPAGIGPDVILGAITQIDRQNSPAICIIGRRSVLESRAAMLDPSGQLGNVVEDLEVEETKNPMSDIVGTADKQNAPAIIEAIETAVAGCAAGNYGSVVTAPINKNVLYGAGFKFPGHTEFLAHLAGANDFGTTKQSTPIPVMMIAGPDLRTVPVTIHIALRDVTNELTTEKIVETCAITHADLVTKFGISAPVLAVSGLNPHAGEERTMGTEDDEIIKPAIAQLQAKGIDARGPIPADTMFHKRARETYDVAICMYHDQALIPAKTLAFDDGVNVTLGLPFIRTSPDHGTAYEIAGTGKARADSMMAALKMASQMMAQNAGVRQ